MDINEQAVKLDVTAEVIAKTRVRVQHLVGEMQQIIEIETQGADDMVKVIAAVDSLVKKEDK